MAVGALKAKVIRQLRSVVDGWENIVTGHGTDRDKRMGARVKAVPTSNTHQTFEDLYHGDDIAAKIADLPPQEMVKKWISLSVDLGKGRDRNAPDDSPTEVADAILQALNDLGTKGSMREALTWARVYGGALVFIAADDGGGANASMAEPLNEDRIKSIDSLIVYDRFEVTIETEYSDKDNPKFGQPETYRINTISTPRGHTLHLGDTNRGNIIHETRMIRFDGAMTSRRRRIVNTGWHDSIYVKIMDQLADFGISWAGMANLLADFAQAVLKMKGLGDAIASDEGDLVLRRIEIMDLCRSSMRIIPIDAIDEDFERISTPVSGLSDMLDRLMVRIATAANIPVTVLFGRSPAGFQATGASDLTIWYDQVESMQETILRPALTRLIDLILKSAEGPTRGKTPDGWELSFNPLWQLGRDDEIKAREAQSKTDVGYIDTGVLTPDEVAESRFGGETYSFETQLDKEARAEPPPEPEPEPAPVPAPPPIPEPEPQPEPIE